MHLIVEKFGANWKRSGTVRAHPENPCRTIKQPQSRNRQPLGWRKNRRADRIDETNEEKLKAWGIKGNFFARIEISAKPSWHYYKQRKVTVGF